MILFRGEDITLKFATISICSTLGLTILSSIVFLKSIRKILRLEWLGRVRRNKFSYWLKFNRKSWSLGAAV